jgi:hypothetical protein
MNPVRKLIDDLIEKKLWPVALMLVVTAIAIPVMISGGGSDPASDTPDPSFASAPAAAASTPAVELVGPPAVRTRSGAVRDPFRRKKVAAASTQSSSPATSEAPKSGGSSGSASTGDSKASTDKPATTTHKATPAIKQAAANRAARMAYQTVVRFTRPGGTRERPLARLAVLGNTSNPALQYTGVSSDGRYAIFVLGTRARVAGSGACVIADPCRAVGLQRGDKVTVEVLGADQSVRRYVVEVTVLRKLALPTAAGARAWRARIDAAGRDVRRTLRKDPVTDAMFAQLRYVASTGTLRLVR